MSDPDSQSQILTWDDDALVRQVGRALIDSGLGDEMSLFSPGRPVWSADTVGELYELYNEHLDYGAGTFLDKLRGQIGHGSDEVKLLTAELLTLHALPLFNLKATTKRERIGEILSWMSEPVPLPAEVSAAFEQYSWNGGHGAHSMIWKWLADAASFVRSWWDLPEAERVQALDDPWKWLGADRPFYSGKHKKHGMNLQVIASPAGDILWVSGPLPGSVHDKKAEWIWGVLAELRRRPAWSSWPTRATRAAAHAKSPVQGGRTSRNPRKTPTAPTRNCAHPASAPTPSSRPGASCASSAAAPGAPGSSPRPSTFFRPVRQTQDEKHSVCARKAVTKFASSRWRTDRSGTGRGFPSQNRIAAALRN